MSTHNINTNRFLLLCCAVIVFASACSNNPAPPRVNVPTVDVVVVQEQEIANRWEAVGRVDSKDIVQIQSRVEGFLIERDFVEGDIVNRDKVLFKIDPKPFEAELLLAKANVEKAKAALVESKQNLARGQELYDGKNISKSELDAYTSTERQAAAEVDAAKAQVYSAAINLGYTTISAPINGRIGKTIFSVGNLISPSSGTLATIYSIDPMYVYFTIDEKDVVTYRTKWGYGPPPSLIYELFLPNGDMYGHQGKMDYEQPFIDKDTGTIDLRCVFPNPENLLLAGMYVTVIIEEATKHLMPLIPQAAVQQSQSGYAVLIVDTDNVAKERDVELGRRVDAMWVVTKGVQAGERIIVKGLQKVQKNAKVEPHIVTVDPKTGVIVEHPDAGIKGKLPRTSPASPKQPHSTDQSSSDTNGTTPDTQTSPTDRTIPSGQQGHPEPAQQNKNPGAPRWTDIKPDAGSAPTESSTELPTDPRDSMPQNRRDSLDRQNLMQPDSSDSPIERAPAPRPQYTIEDKDAPKIGTDAEPSSMRY